MNHQVTFLGPFGATFSHDAYLELCRHYGAPAVTDENYVAANSNEQVLTAIIAHGGYGAIAMETAAQGRVDEPVESFIQLLKHYNHANCPITVLGAVKMRLNFNLMVRQDETDRDRITTVVCHIKSRGACQKNLQATRLRIVEVDSNGEAARLVAEDASFKNAAALGPISAAATYGLKVIQSGFEDNPAFTTFFLVTPSSHLPEQGEKNRALLVFEVSHEPNALVSALAVLGSDRFNLIHVHSMETGNSQYHFCAEVDVPKDRIDDFHQTCKKFAQVTAKRIVFGPFEVYRR